MMEEEWLRCREPNLMLEFLRNQASERKLRLFCVACDIAADTGGKYLGAFERHADGIATKEDEWLLGNDWTPAWESACLSLGYTGDSQFDADVIRDIFGNPFRPVAFSPEWRTSTVVALAEGIYAERAFGRMPILADALQDAGCDNEEMLSHCRDTALTHVRGCWVVDLVLGKE